MAESWSLVEVAATVADYFAMLQDELEGRPYEKSKHNKALQQQLRGRSKQAIEYKHANISAVLVELGLPYIDGYKPRGNYQGLLMEEVVARLDADGSIERVTADIVDARVGTPSPSLALDDVFVPAPVREKVPARVAERSVAAPVPRRDVNYLEREAKNASLGLAGERFALDAEHQRLWRQGHRRLADRVEHVAKTQGDGLGYDILSFEPDGRERLIEVKTTNFGVMTPFYASRKEVMVAEERASSYHLYRVFGFRGAPKLFVLPGSLRQSCILDPIQYRASLP